MNDEIGLFSPKLTRSSSIFRNLKLHYFQEMSQQNLKRQYLEEQQEEENGNVSIAEVNSECPFNCEDTGKENELSDRLPLPLELNCQIFECLKFGIQRKFIGGLGRGIYGMFRQKVLTKVG
jgi:hypothetical protein